MKLRDLKDHNRKLWNELYRKIEKIQPVQEGISEISDHFKSRGIKRVLDLGCGSGRHTLYFAEQGFDMYGFDISNEGIRIARKISQEKDYQINLAVGSMYKKLPYKDNFFDGVICIRALHHSTINYIRTAIKEIERVLRPKGIVYVTVPKKKSKHKRLPFKEIEDRTYIPLEGNEKGVVHYLFNKNLIRKEFNKFKIHRLWVVYGPKDWEIYYYILGELKIE